MITKKNQHGYMPKKTYDVVQVVVGDYFFKAMLFCFVFSVSKANYLQLSHTYKKLLISRGVGVESYVFERD